MNKFLINTLIIVVASVGLLNFTSCEDDDPPPPPSPVPAIYKFNNTENVNKPIFWSMSTSDDKNKLPLSYSWAMLKQGFEETSSDSIFLPTIQYTGNYNVILTVKTAQGAVSVNDTLIYYCSRINPEIDNPYLLNLSADAAKGLYIKNWVLSNKYGHIIMGASEGINAGGFIDYVNDSIIKTTYYPADSLIYADAEAYGGIMTFGIDNQTYKNTGPDKWITNWYFANTEFGYKQAEGVDICIDVTTGLDTVGNFSLVENDDGTVFLEFNDKNFLLYYEGKTSKSKYQVLALYKDLFVVRKMYFDANGDPAGYRMLFYVPEENKNDEIPDYPLSVKNPPFKITN